MPQPYIVFDDIELDQFISVGDSVTIQGTLYGPDGTPIAGHQFGVDDGLTLTSYTGPTTDAQGRFTHSTAAAQAGAAQVAFDLPDPAGWQATFVNVSESADEYRNASTAAPSLFYENTGSDPVVVTLEINHVSIRQIVHPGQRAEVLRTANRRDHMSSRTVPYVGLVGGGTAANVAVTVDGDLVVQGSATLGTSILRGRVYYTNQGDWGGAGRQTSASGWRG